jgi:ADP-ribosylglycohydrolase/protein-tyrosine phosphatase
MTESIALPMRLEGAVWGHLIGDAMGVPYEFRSPERVGEVRWGEHGTHGKPAGTWSDDGALMLALLDSLTTVGFDTNDQGRRALAWWREGRYTPDGKYFDIGTTTIRALQAIEAGVPGEQAGPTDHRSGSNGSLMRILPIAPWGHATKLSEAELVDHALRASRVTHGHPEALAACAVYVLLASALMRGRTPRRSLDWAIATARRHLPAELQPALTTLIDWPISHEPEGRGGALNAFWSAWRAFAGARSYRGTIERAIRYGNDTDTTAAIAGGLAGMRWGIDGIPLEWRRGMLGRDVVVPILDWLMNAHGWKTSTTHLIRVDWVDLSSVPGLKGATGRLGMTFLPGKQYVGWHGPTWRDLELDVTRLRTEFGCEVFLLLVEDHELVTTRTTALARLMADAGIELRRHPVVDMDVPTDRAAYRTTLDGLRAAVAEGRRVVVACRGGLGRTGTAVACLLVGAGMEPRAAIDLTRASRRNTIERGSQVEWVRDWGDK